VGAVRDLTQERRRRELLVLEPAQRVALHWLTGEVFEGPAPCEQRRRPYRKNSKARVSTGKIAA
jgi:hypothetical protein